MSRGIFAGGGSESNVIDYITIENIGNATDFGDLTQGRRELAGTSNGTNNRGVFGGGGDGAYRFVFRDTIDYITINSIGNSTTFGDLTVARQRCGAASNA